VSRFDGWRYPPPNELMQPFAYKFWKNGQMFVMKGGPHDGMLLRLFPGPIEGKDESGWDVVYFEDAVYRRPEQVDPYLPRSGKPNKHRTNVPHMEHDVSGLVVPVLAVA
jgi:hypothetical protein